MVCESCEHVSLRVIMVFHSGDPCGYCTYFFTTKVFFCFLPIAAGRDKKLFKVFFCPEYLTLPLKSTLLFPHDCCHLKKLDFKLQAWHKCCSKTMVMFNINNRRIFTTIRSNKELQALRQLNLNFFLTSSQWFS